MVNEIIRIYFVKPILVHWCEHTHFRIPILLQILLHNCIVIINVWYLAGARNFCLLQKSRPAVGPTQSHILWVPRVLFALVIGRCLKLITCLRLVLRLRMSGAILPLSQCTFVACTSYLKILWKPNATHEVAWVFQIFRCSKETCFADSAKMMSVRRKFLGETGISFFFLRSCDRAS